MASYSVTFADGTSHAYDNVPEGVTQAEIDARAAQDFPNKQIKEVGSANPPEPEYHTNPGVATAGFAQTGFDTVVKPVAHFVMNHPIESAVATAVAPEWMTRHIPGVNQLAQYGRGILQKASGVTPTTAEQSQMWQNLGQRYGQAQEAAQGMFQRGAQAVGQGLNTAGQAISNTAQRLAPAAETLAPYARMATGAGLMLHSPSLNTGEAQQIAQIHAQQDRQRQINQAITDEAARKALGPVAPGQ